MPSSDSEFSVDELSPVLQNAEDVPAVGISLGSMSSNDDALPERVRGRAIEKLRPPLQVARQVTAVAALGFAVGAATVVAAKKRGRPSLRRRRKKSKGILGEILGSNSFLVDVHLIKRKK